MPVYSPTPQSIKSAFEQLGFSPFGTLQYRKICDCYLHFTWYLIPHHRVGKVLYSIPPLEKMEELPWESWYLDGGRETHHVHHAVRQHPDDYAWIQKDPTEERPAEVIGKTWFWYDEKEMMPVLLSAAETKG